MTDSPRIATERVDKLAGVDALASEWTALESATPEATGFQSFAWCRTWLAVAGDRARARVLCVREEGRLVMLLPLQVERRFGVVIARWIGEPMTQYGDALALPGEKRAQWFAAAQAKMARWGDVDLFALTRLRAGSVLSDGTVAGEPFSAPYVDLRASKPKRHKSIERRVKRLEAHGAVLLEEAESPAKRESVTRHALALKRAWLGGKGAYSAGLSNPVSEDFLAALAREGFLRANILRVGGEIGAIDLGFVGGGVYRSLLGCYDDRFAEGSPGQALTGRLIARCAEEGLSAYDMLLPADAYKSAWATGETQIEARFLPTSPRGRVAAFAIAELRPLAKRMLRAAGPWRAWLISAFSFSRRPASLSPSRREETAT